MLSLAGSVVWLICQDATSLAVCFSQFYPIDGAKSTLNDTETGHNTVCYRLLFSLPVNCMLMGRPSVCH